jgi:hypothetical protein
VKNLFCGSAYVRERARRASLFARANRDGRSQLGRAVVRFNRIAAIAGALALIAPLGAFAQSNAVPARIVTQINESSLTTLRGNTHPLARAQYDQGAVADSLPMHRMLLLLQRNPQQETALRTLIDQQQSRISPSFHQWLTPQQFGQQYGPAPADIQTVTSWLTSHGFQVARVSTGGTLIEFSGTAGQVLSAFHTQIHHYAVNGEEHFANSTDPQIPTALASVVAGPVSLHNFPRKAQSHIRGVFQKNRNTGKITPVPSPTFSFNSTDCTSNSIFSSNCNALGPGDFAAIYNENPLLTTGISGHVIDGTGQTIAIVGDSEICTASSPDFGGCTVDDVANFRSLFGLSTTNLPTVILDGPDPGFNSDEVEGDLDVQWSGAIAPGAAIDFVIAEGTEASAGTDLAAEYVVDNNLAPVLSESFSQCEAFLLANGNLFESELWEQAAAQGITVVVSAGDSGSAGCDNQDTQTSAVNGANVNGIASTPFNVAAGGTDFDFTATGYPTAFWSASNTPTTEVSALGYIAETTWNDSCARSGVTGCNSLAATSPLLNINGGGGGQSNCVAAATDLSGNITCPTASYTNATIPGWPKPAYQPTATGSGLTVANDLTRDLPDISLFASDGLLSNSFYIVCDSDISGGPCNLSQSFINFVGVGGTSSSAPSFAGIMALVNQNMVVNNSVPAGQGQGNANYVLYSLASGQTAASTLGGYSCNSSTAPNSACIFNDVTKGNNSVPCAAGSFNCSNTGATGLGVIETGTPANTPSYIAGPGLDLATGLGSINVSNLVNMWPNMNTGVGSFTPTTTTLCLSTTSGACASSTTASSLPATIPHGTTVYVNIGVTSAKGAPSNSTAPEDVALIGAFPAPCTANCPVDRFDANTGNADIYQLTSGTISASTNELVGGTYTVSARYGGDGKFGSSSSTPGISIDITPENSTTSLSVFAASGNNSVAISSVPYGAFDTIRADVKGASGLETGTGIVTLLDNGKPIVTPFDTTSNSFPLNTEGYTEDQTTFLSVGPHSFTGQYGGDASYAASLISTAVPLTVTLGPTTSTVHSSVSSVAPNTNFTLTAFIDTQSTANPTGGSQGLPPSGTVTFFSGSTSLGSAPVSAIPTGDANFFDESTATLSTATLTATGTITAVYNGDVNYSTSTSAGVTVTVTNGATFNLSPANNGVMTVGAPGQSGTDTITVTGSGGFSGTITLSSAVSMTPPSATDVPTCSFGAPDQNFTAPGTITLSTTSETGSATMTCATTAAAQMLPGPSNRPSGRVWPLAGVAISLAGAFFLFMVPRQRRWKLVPLAVLLAVVAAAGISCNGRGLSGGSTNPGTTTGTYTFTVTATPSTGTAQTTAITVNVQ